MDTLTSNVSWLRYLLMFPDTWLGPASFELFLWWFFKCDFIYADPSQMLNLGLRYKYGNIDFNERIQISVVVP